MTRYSDDHTIVLAGYGFDEAGPYLSLNDIEEGEQRRYPVQGRTFSLTRLPKRRCIGRFDLETQTKVPCPLHVELLPDTKDTMCPACQEATGFNPSFYYADFVSPQQRAYNLTPHFVYLAYFSPQYVKAGISAEIRGRGRLLEQGARAACIVGRFDDAYQARDLEAALCAQQGIWETMRSSKKIDLLANERYDPVEAAVVLKDMMAQLGREDAVTRQGFDASSPVQDLSAYYFGGSSPSLGSMQVADGFDDVCGGLCVGMIGSVLVFEQAGMKYLMSIKSWESHEIDVREGEVLCTYDFIPQQMSLL